MKDRIAKKKAKLYLAGKLSFPVVEEEYQAYNDGRPPVIKYYANLHPRVCREVLKLARRRGWDGCHWNSPLLIELDKTELIRWEEEHE